MCQSLLRLAASSRGVIASVGKVSILLRELTPADIPQLVELNNDAYPAVPIVDEDEFAMLTAVCSLTLVAVHEADPGDPIAFVLTVDPGADYASENYKYFEARDSDSLYIDRIVVGEEQRGSGLGRILYGAVFERAREDGRTEVTCEVNIQPPNPESLAFHDRMGFSRVGTQSTKGGSIVVALLAAPVGADV